MIRPLAIALFLSACAAVPPAAELPPLGVALACNAEVDFDIDAYGRRTDDGQLSLPVALTLPAGDAPGSFCMATGCEPATVTRVALSRTPDWAARIDTDGVDRGVVTLSPDRSRFEFTQPTDAGGVQVWTGPCAPAGS